MIALLQTSQKDFVESTW